jgi:DNA-binding transcriptional ArsR family regulator
VRGVQSERVFEVAAEFFSLLSTPLRLRILNQLCQGDKSVAQLLEVVPTTQPNMSQHLATLYRAGLVTRRREGSQVFYSLQSERAVLFCKSVCPQFEVPDEAGAAPASEMHGHH